MGKKTLILSQQQLDEICGGDSSYLDGLTTNPDMAHDFAAEITADGGLDQGYADATTTDDFADDMTNSWRGNAKLHGMGPITVREWREIYLEEKEHGNRRLKNRQFGAQNGEAGKSYGATKTALSRLNKAQQTMKKGATPEIRAKAAQTASKMQKNWGGIGLAAQQYGSAKTLDRTQVSNKPEGTKKLANGAKNMGGVFVSE